jgi:hypothetical protein
MTRKTILAIAAMAVVMPGVAHAQTKYFSRVGLPKATASAGTPATPPAGAKTLMCSEIKMGFTVHPVDLVQNVGTAASVPDALALCNKFGAQYGELLKDMTFCHTQYDYQQKHWFTQLYRGTLYDTSKLDPNSVNWRGVGSCTYYP